MMQVRAAPLGAYRRGCRGARLSPRCRLRSPSAWAARSTEVGGGGSARRRVRVCGGGSRLVGEKRIGKPRAETEDEAASAYHMIGDRRLDGRIDGCARWMSFTAAPMRTC